MKIFIIIIGLSLIVICWIMKISRIIKEHRNLFSGSTLSETLLMILGFLITICGVFI